MTYFMLIVIFIITFGIVICYYEHRISKILNAPTSCPPLDDALKSAKEIGYFLAERANWNSHILATKGAKKYQSQDVSNIYRGKNYQVATFIRLCHALGCEVSIHQKGVEDLEEEG